MKLRLYALSSAALLGLWGCGHVDPALAWDTQPDGTVILRSKVGAFQTTPAAAPDLERVLAGEPGDRRHYALDATLGPTNTPDALDRHR